jgi:PDZ domain/Cytochrome c
MSDTEPGKSVDPPSRAKDLAGWVLAIAAGLVGGALFTQWQRPAVDGPGPEPTPPVVDEPDRSSPAARALGVGVLGTDAGLELKKVFAGGAAEKAGLLVGDVILEVEGRTVFLDVGGTLLGDERVLLDALAHAQESVTLTLLRAESGEQETISVAFVEEGSFESRLAAELIAKAVRQLQNAPREGGLWPHYTTASRPSVASSALVAAALARSEEQVGVVLHRAAVRSLLRHQAEDGSLQELGQVEPHAVYATSLLINALAGSSDPDWVAAREKAVAWVAAAQVAEAQAYNPIDARYGGWSYFGGYRSAALRTDISVLRYALQGLEAGGLAGSDEAWFRAGLWLDEAQNQSLITRSDDPSHDQEKTARDGGFAFQPRMSKNAPPILVGDDLVVFRSYGSATCDGTQALLLVEGIDLREHIMPGPPPLADDRVRAGLNWLAVNYDLGQNPGFDPDPQGWGEGIYYYYLAALAQTLHRAGVWEVVEFDGTRHVWAAELVRQLANLEEEGRLDDGTKGFRGRSDAMHEDSPTIAAAFALIALEEARDRLALGGGATLQAGSKPQLLAVELDGPPPDAGAVARGRHIFLTTGGCTSCHVDGQVDNGPSLVGIADVYLSEYRSPEAAARHLERFLRRPQRGFLWRDHPDREGKEMRAVTTSIVSDEDMPDLLEFLLSRRGSRPVAGQ